MENKDVEMTPTIGGAKSGSNEKPTYEQLEAQVYNLAAQQKELIAQLQQANMFNTFKRLDYCFKVVENRDAFAIEFVDYCKKDIVSIMTVVETPNTEEK